MWRRFVFRVPIHPERPKEIKFQFEITSAELEEANGRNLGTFSFKCFFFFSLKTKDTWTYFQCNYLIELNLKENLISSNFLGESYKIISVII